MKQRFALSIILMLLFFQCGMNFPKKQELFVNLSEDELIGPEHISRFLRRLNQSRLTEGDSLIKIVHIGDSHIQMGYFSGEIRSTLQGAFGGTGIGLFFPNGLCAGYNPIGLDITSPKNWQCDKISNVESTIPMGLVGMAMKSTDAETSINIAFKGKKETILMFAIFHADLSNTHTISCSEGDISTVQLSKNSFITTITMRSKVNEIPVYFTRKANSKQPLVIYGLSVNNRTDMGIDYDSFGVSGGQYKYFAKNAPLLVEQLAGLKPHLMIISLGSNDSYDKSLTKEGYKSMLIEFIKTLRAASPATEFILTTPPDTEYNKSKPVSGAIVNQSIIEAGKEMNCTVWDFYAIMGGYNSYKKWRKEKYANKDGLHLSIKGYQVQGQLFNFALGKELKKQFPESDWLEETEGTIMGTLH